MARARAGTFAGEMQHARMGRAIQPADFGGNGDRGAEFLRLDESAPGQRLAGNAGGKAKIVFNARAGAGLAARGARIGHQNGQAFRGRIYRGCQAGGAGADDGDIEHMIRVQRRQQAQAARERGVGWIAQHAAIRADHKRKIGRAGVFVADQFGAVGVGGGIDGGVGMAVAGQETLQAQHVGVIGRAHQHRAAAGAFDQRDAAQDEGAHDALADFGLADQQGAQWFRRQQQGLHIGDCHAVHERGPAGQLRGLAQEFAGAMGDDGHRLAARVVAGDIHGAIQHDEHAGRVGAGGDQMLAGGETNRLAETADARDIGGRERGE